MSCTTAGPAPSQRNCSAEGLIEIEDIQPGGALNVGGEAVGVEFKCLLVPGADIHDDPAAIGFFQLPEAQVFFCQALDKLQPAAGDAGKIPAFRIGE